MSSQIPDSTLEASSTRFTETSLPSVPNPYVLRPLLSDICLSADDLHSSVVIKCVEFFDGNLYVGTSAAELLHLVQMPPDPASRTSDHTFVLASRLSPIFSAQSGSATDPSKPGIQQILLLPKVSKACILCNWTVTFYSLPELTPLSGTGQVKNCSWIGGIDSNEGNEPADHVFILLSLKRRIQVVCLGETALAFKNIDFAGSTLSVGRGSIACVADTKSYALLDIDKQLKIPLMNILSFDDSAPQGEMREAEGIAADGTRDVLRSYSPAVSRQGLPPQSHSRSTSLGGAILSNFRRRDIQCPREDESALRQTSSAGASLNSRTPASLPSFSMQLQPVEKLITAASHGSLVTNQISAAGLDQHQTTMQPHIASPSPEEFLVVTGTGPSDPGIGMFINLDGDATRPTVEFSEYPMQMATDSVTVKPTALHDQITDDEAAYVLASLSRMYKNRRQYGIEIQSLSSGHKRNAVKHWLSADDVGCPSPYGIHSLIGRGEIQFDEIAMKLTLRRFSPSLGTQVAPRTSSHNSGVRNATAVCALDEEKELSERDDLLDPDSSSDGRRNACEEFAQRLAKVDVSLVVWAGNRMWWAARNPLILQLDAILKAAYPAGIANAHNMDTKAIYSVLGALRGRDARTELHFLTIEYLRQKAGLLLLIELLTSGPKQLLGNELSALEEVLIESKLDARVVLSLIPGLRNEIVEGKRGIWVYGGIKHVLNTFLRSAAADALIEVGMGSLDPRITHFLRRFLFSWREMKGFASVADETEVFKTVDASLILILLELDQHSLRGLRNDLVVKSELKNVVDGGVDCFERAVILLESYHRLFLLSRLYQSRKMAGDVLATWKRIIEGEHDDGQELINGEEHMREYLSKISSRPLVQEHGVWLAKRNPRLGAEVFAGKVSRTEGFKPARVVELFREEAPAAVKYYLEHLVFNMGRATYVNDLITFYIDITLAKLKSSAACRQAVLASYDAYRVLGSPKPPYYHFLAANAAASDETWRSRLKLLQLLSGFHNYDVMAVRARIAQPFGELLVPECIILAGREHCDQDALRLLVHELGDYDTALYYCVRGVANFNKSADYHNCDGDADDLSHSVERRRLLFQAVLREFLLIDNVSDRFEQVSTLLEHLGAWFDVDEVLDLLPDVWPVSGLAGFLTGVFKRLTRERYQGVMIRGLGAAENVRVSYSLLLGTKTQGLHDEIRGKAATKYEIAA